MSTSAAFSLLTALAAWGLKFDLKRANKKIKQTENEATLYYAY
jgi:hypothetical protein